MVVKESRHAVFLFFFFCIYLGHLSWSAITYIWLSHCRDILPVLFLRTVKAMSSLTVCCISQKQRHSNWDLHGQTSKDENIDPILGNTNVALYIDINPLSCVQNMLAFSNTCRDTVYLTLNCFIVYTMKVLLFSLLITYPFPWNCICFYVLYVCAPLHSTLSSYG